MSNSNLVDLMSYYFNLNLIELSLEVLRRQFYVNQRYSFFALETAKKALELTQDRKFTFSFK